MAEHSEIVNNFLRRYENPPGFLSREKKEKKGFCAPLFGCCVATKSCCVNLLAGMWNEDNASDDGEGGPSRTVTASIKPTKKEKTAALFHLGKLQGGEGDTNAEKKKPAAAAGGVSLSLRNAVLGVKAEQFLARKKIAKEKVMDSAFYGQLSWPTMMLYALPAAGFLGARYSKWSYMPKFYIEDYPKASMG